MNTDYFLGCQTEIKLEDGNMLTTCENCGHSLLNMKDRSSSPATPETEDNTIENGTSNEVIWAQIITEPPLTFKNIFNFEFCYSVEGQKIFSCDKDRRRQNLKNDISIFFFVN